MKVYAFEWTTCIYESGYEVISLHRTRKKAHAAKDAFIADAIEAHDALWAEMGETSPFSALMHQEGRVRAIKIQ